MVNISILWIELGRQVLLSTQFTINHFKMDDGKNSYAVDNVFQTLSVILWMVILIDVTKYCIITSI